MIENNNWCFACGAANPIGLHLTFREENDTYYTEFTSSKEYQGYDGVLHGGIISTLLDEVMAGYVYFKGLHGVTARLEIRYRQPTPIGEKLIVSGKVLRQHGKLYELEGKIELADGTVTAEAKSTVIVLKDEKK